jgi:hypothetical protein
MLDMKLVFSFTPGGCSPYRLPSGIKPLGMGHLHHPKRIRSVLEDTQS